MEITEIQEHLSEAMLLYDLVITATEEGFKLTDPKDRHNLILFSETLEGLAKQSAESIWLHREWNNRPYDSYSGAINAIYPSSMQIIYKNSIWNYEKLLPEY